MVTIIGWIGSMLFALCALPQAIKIYQTKSASDISWWFIGMWFLGEILSFNYVFITNMQSGTFQYPILWNYIINFVILCYIIYTKYIYDSRNKP